MAAKKTTNTAPAVVTAPAEEVVAKPKKTAKSVEAKVTALTGLNLRENASIDSTVLEVIPYEAVVTVAGDTNKEWVKVTTPEGNNGFVMSQFLAF